MGAATGPDAARRRWVLGLGLVPALLSTLGPALTLTGCASTRTAEQPGLAVRTGRFAISGEAVAEPVSGRFELLAQDNGEQRFWLMDPLGVVRAGLLRATGGWLLTDSAGRPVPTARLEEVSQSQLGLSASEWPRLGSALDRGVAHLLVARAEPFQAIEPTPRGPLRLRLLADTD